MRGLPVFFRVTTLPASSVQAVPLGPALAAVAFLARTKKPSNGWALLEFFDLAIELMQHLPDLIWIQINKHAFK